MYIKVRYMNSSSMKTNNKIRKCFAELMKEKKSLSKITVTELVKKADITRATFYTHYDDIYDIANDYQEETLEIINKEENKINTIEDLFTFFDNVFILLKENENIYRMLLTSNEPLIFIDKIKKIAIEKIYRCLLNNNITTPNLKFYIACYVDGVLIQTLRYFREKDIYTLDEINFKAKELFKIIFKINN